MAEEQPTLAAFFKGWEDYQDHIIKAIAPLSADQLALRAAPHLRSIGELAAHMVATRAGWFHRAIGEGSEETAPLMQWHGGDAPARTADELVGGLEATWRLIRGSLARWTLDDLARPFQVERGGQKITFTRQWITWHLIEHDLHHGGEISFSLGMHGLAAPDI